MHEHLAGQKAVARSGEHEVVDRQHADEVFAGGDDGEAGPVAGEAGEQGFRARGSAVRAVGAYDEWRAGAQFVTVGTALSRADSR